MKEILLSLLASFLVTIGCSGSAPAQNRASLTGTINDELRAAIVGAAITLISSSGVQRTSISNGEGRYSFTGLAPGKYKMRVSAQGFATSDEMEVDVKLSGQIRLNVTLKVAAIESQVQVSAGSGLSTDSSSNANQLLITGRDLEALPDNPDDLAVALQALAGPSTGPNGGEIFIDGLTSGQMLRRDSIAEIRINQNPFGAESDSPGGSINVITRSAADQFHGDISVLFNDESLNSRNPLQIASSRRMPFQARNAGVNLTGPFRKKKVSFIFNLDHHEIDDNELVRAVVLDSTLTEVQIGQGVPVFQRDTALLTRIDYAVNPKNTVIARYQYYHYKLRNLGVGGFSLPERGYDRDSSYNFFRFAVTSALNANAFNVAEFQYMRNNYSNVARSFALTLNVSGSFAGGGSSVGRAVNTTGRWELQNLTQLQRATHTIKIGGRMRRVSSDDIDPTNFNGEWSFAGGTSGLTSLQRYQLTLELMRQGLSPASVRTAGGGAAQFTIALGNPRATVAQTDLALYAQDDWRIRPNLTFTYGLRYEIQTNASGKLGFAPRLSAAWVPGANKQNRTPRTVIRVGAGIFYSRFNEAATLTANRFNGAGVRQFTFSESANPQLPTDPSTLAVLNSFRCADGSITPNCVTALPSIAGLSATQQTVWRIQPGVRAPMIYALGGQVERQLPRNITLTVGVLGVQVFHVIRSRDINAPVPGTITLATPTGLRPNNRAGEINQIESSGRMSQQRLVIGFNARPNSKLSVSGNYVLSRTMNDSDGLGGDGYPPFPRDSYDLQGEWAPASNDVRHRLTVFGSYNNPRLWKLVWAPLIVASSAPPFDIVTGSDSNLDRQFTDRPSFAGPTANCSSMMIRCTKYGNFNLAPAAGDKIIPRNFGRGTGSFTVNLRISRTFGFRQREQTDARGTSQDTQRKPVPAKYNLTVAFAFQNLFNTANLAPPIGNLSSPLFGQSQSLVGPGGFSGGGSANAGNRRIYLNVRFSF